MQALKILTLPDPFLKKKLLYVVKVDDRIRAIAASMTEVMLQNTRCVGLAASQLGIDLRIVVVDASLGAKKHPNHGRLTLINPVITGSAGRQMFREGCLSVPDFTGNVFRAEEITVEYRDLEGNKASLSTNGFESVLIQHEIDHLDGILFLDRVGSLKTDVFRRKQICK